ncbi:MULTISPECIES: hypothetical protein [Trichocoleus]|uniref:Uncharacterized protein n=1 Tax=Trichocoleus desertorum GB2-A4 TaxID=2933944 RepID=A0ABV0JF76_9CYAN|nr:hypothetical protein [Trichocoleus sp. FACHB-46]MBD1862345.1 hypothetical protein [Trichocoleus sp. FACHB-46]
MPDQKEILAEEQVNVLAPFLEAAQAIAVLDHRSVEAPHVRGEAQKLIALLQDTPTISRRHLSELALSQLEMAQLLLESVKDWIEVANSVKSRRTASVRFRSAIKALARVNRLLTSLIKAQAAAQKSQQAWAQRR